MAKVTDLPAGPERKYDSVLNWDVASEDDPKALARHACEASTLARLIVAGLEVDELENAGNSVTGLEMKLSRASTTVAELLCFKLARELGALEGK
jgi:hypothetical protein